jgi:hypothetical protein
MKTAPAAITARHSHLLRAARSAGEAFACASDNSGPAGDRSIALIATWIGAGALAALWMFLIY